MYKNGNVIFKRNKRNWTKVFAETYQYDKNIDDSGMGCGHKKTETKIAWIKLVSEEGRPNSWYISTAYFKKCINKG